MRYGAGLVIGKEFIPWNDVRDIDIVGEKVEAGLILGQTPFTYEEAVEVAV